MQTSVNLVRTMKLTAACGVALITSLLVGCAGIAGPKVVQQSASVVDYLYPGGSQAPQLEESMVKLRAPVSVGLAFVPSNARGASLPEAERMRLLEKVKASFVQHGSVGKIEIIPTQYLQSRGGFDNLQQAARMFRVDLVALVSYDQVRFNDANSLSFLYWTIIGAYVVHGNQYDVRTMIDVSVFDVATRRLLFRAPGLSQLDGGGNAANFSERSRAAQSLGYEKAIDNLLPNLHDAMERFRTRIKSDASFQVVAGQSKESTP